MDARNTAQQQYNKNTTPDPCLTKVSSSLSTSNVCDKTPKEDLDQCKDTGKASDSKYKCAKRYSCETLFVKDTEANTCNFERCKVQR
jgi:hypothetical protein